ncbi:MAG: hypothetical protein JXB40_04420 [Candidatus Omnitrophica bacterium]|nr:hypothetical protein [Candidatus Omnitrophota bacterium]
MRCVVLAAAMLFALCANACSVENIGASSSEKRALAYDEVVSESEDAEEPVSRVGVMNPGQIYDGNTGFPNIVDSDADMDIDSD